MAYFLFRFPIFPLALYTMKGIGQVSGCSQWWEFFIKCCFLGGLSDYFTLDEIFIYFMSGVRLPIKPIKKSIKPRSDAVYKC